MSSTIGDFRYKSILELIRLMLMKAQGAIEQDVAIIECKRPDIGPKRVIESRDGGKIDGGDSGSDQHRRDQDVQAVDCASRQEPGERVGSALDENTPETALSEGLDDVRRT